MQVLLILWAVNCQNALNCLLKYMIGFDIDKKELLNIEGISCFAIFLEHKFCQ